VDGQHEPAGGFPGGGGKVGPGRDAAKRWERVLATWHIPS